jgi:hypothetical protein
MKKASSTCDTTFILHSLRINCSIYSFQDRLIRNTLNVNLIVQSRAKEQNPDNDDNV